MTLLFLSSWNRIPPLVLLYSLSLYHSICVQIDEIESSASSDTTSMEKKPSDDLHHHQPQLHQQALKCPRCDSSNTKFCYYNNYSLSQPRHFCKGCKRYWTRGGTLRNVPIGGGCRKNKRVKRSATSSPSSTPAPVPLPTLSSSTTHTTVKGVNPMIYNQSADIPLNLARLSSTGYDNVESQFNAFQFGFSSPNMIASTLGGCGYASQGYDSCKEYKNEIHPTTLSNDVVTSNSILPNFPFFLGSSSSSSTTCLIPTNLQQYSFNLGGLKETRPTNNIQGSFNDQMAITKEVKVEDGGKEIIQSPMEQMGLLDLSAAYWNSMNAGAWADLSHYGSSVTSLI